MLLRAEDHATFKPDIEQDGAEFWASYRVEGRVNGQPMTQTDRRMFASEQEARTWLVGEAERRGFRAVESGKRTAA